uniref:RRM domain-containing protein n=1 Tax=Aegilops tauschii subsp. strangulata TaxID=200361 RepID=A0A453B1X8_AEGTS
EMSRFGRSGPPPIRDTYSLLVLNITFRTTADDLFPLFDKYGEVVDIYIPRDRSRTGDSRGFAFVRYKYEDEAQKAVDRLDGRLVDGREMMVQFAKYGPNAERIQKGRIMETVPKPRGRSRSRSPRRGYRDDHRGRDSRRRSRSRSGDRYGRDRYRERDHHRRSRSRSTSPDDYKRRGRDRSPSRSRSRSYSPDDDRKGGRDSLSPARRSTSRSPRKTPPPREGSPAKRNDDRSPAKRNDDRSPVRRNDDRSPVRRNDDRSPVRRNDDRSPDSRSPST